MKKYILLLTLPFLLAQCKKEGFPDITTSGKNSFGCKVNGVEWTPKGNPDDIGIFLGNSPINARYNENLEAMVFSVFRDRNGKSTQSISLAFSVKDGEGETTLFESNSTIMRGFECPHYDIDFSSTATVNLLRFDEENSIVAGTFEFDAVSIDDCINTLEVREGRFDVKYTI